MSELEALTLSIPVDKNGERITPTEEFSNAELTVFKPLTPAEQELMNHDQKYPYVSGMFLDEEATKAMREIQGIEPKGTLTHESPAETYIGNVVKPIKDFAKDLPKALEGGAKTYLTQGVLTTQEEKEAGIRTTGRIMSVVRWGFWRFIEHPLSTFVEDQQNAQVEEGMTYPEKIKHRMSVMSKMGQAYVPFKQIPKEEYGTYGKIWERYYHDAHTLRWGEEPKEVPDWYIMMASYGSAVAFENIAMMGSIAGAEMLATRPATAVESAYIKDYFRPLTEFLKANKVEGKYPKEGFVLKIDNKRELFINKYITAVLNGDVIRIPKWAKIKKPPMKAPSSEMGKIFGKHLGNADVLPVTGKEVQLLPMSPKPLISPIVSSTVVPVEEHLENYVGTAWQRSTSRALMFREEIETLMAGKTDEATFLMKETKSGKEYGMRKRLREGGLEGGWTHLEKNKVISKVSKPLNAVSASCVNCNPSYACAEFCYAYTGTGSWGSSLAKAELMDVLANKDPDRMADLIIKEYPKSIVGKQGGALRFFDRGDISDAWVKVIKRLNDAGIRTQVFSKQPSILSKVDESNIRLLSIDSTNMPLAEGNDLPIAMNYGGDVERDLEFLEKNKERIQVILPIRGVATKEDIAKLPAWTKPLQCPVDSGKKKIGTGKDDWTCIKCDSGKGLGCYHGQTGEMNAPKMYKSAEEFIKAQGTLLYHGTNFEGDIKKFKVSLARDGLPAGIHFTTREKTGYGKNTIQASVDIKNPMVVDFRGGKWYVKNKYSGKLVPKELPSMGEAQAKGHDGIIIKWKDGSDQYIAFSPDQIKTKQQLTDIWNDANIEGNIKAGGQVIDPEDVAKFRKYLQLPDENKEIKVFKLDNPMVIKDIFKEEHKLKTNENVYVYPLKNNRYLIKDGEPFIVEGGQGEKLYNKKGALTSSFAPELEGTEVEVLSSKPVSTGSLRQAFQNISKGVWQLSTDVNQYQIHQNEKGGEINKGFKAIRLTPALEALVYSDYYQEIGIYPTLRDAQNAIIAEVMSQRPKSIETTRYNKPDLTLSGGEDYKETLIKLPEPVRLTDAEKEEYNRLTRILSKRDLTTAERELRTYLNEKDTKAITEKALEYNDPHFIGKKNIVAHLRSNLRKYKEKNDTYFLEEAQSQWMLDARKAGFDTKTDIEKLKRDKAVAEEEFLATVRKVAERAGIKVFKKRYIDADGDIDSIMVWDGERNHAYPLNTKVALNEISKKFKEDYDTDLDEEWLEKADKLSDLEYEIEMKKGKIPYHPLVRKWLTLAIKKALIDAVQGGQKYFAWISGQQTADRYDLSKHIKSLEIRTAKGHLGEKGDAYSLKLETHQGDKHSVRELLDKEGLEKNIGKELTKRFLESEEDFVEWKGLDLKVGGEWAINLYDKQIPALIKELTGQTPQLIDFTGKDGDWVKMGDWWAYAKDKYGLSKEDAIAESRSGSNRYYEYIDQGGGTKQQGIELTPEVKEKIFGGIKGGGMASPPIKPPETPPVATAGTPEEFPSKEIVAEKVARNLKLTDVEKKAYPDLAKIAKKMEFYKRYKLPVPPSILEQLGITQPIKRPPPVSKILGKESAETFEVTLKQMFQEAYKTSRMTEDRIKELQRKVKDLVQQSGLEPKDIKKFMESIINIQSDEDFRKAIPRLKQRVNDLIDTVKRNTSVKNIKKIAKYYEKSSIPVEYKDQLDAILAKFVFKQKTPKTARKLESMRAFVERMKEEGQEINIPAEQLALLDKKYVTDLTTDELQQVEEVIERLYYQGRMKNKLITSQKERNLENVVEKFVKQVSKGKGLSGEGSFFKVIRENIESFKGKTEQQVKDYLIRNMSPELLLNMMDNFDTNGIITQTVFEPLWKATLEEMTSGDKVLTKIKKFHEGAIDLKTLNQVIGKDKFKGMTRSNALAVYALSKNEAGLRRLLGSGLTEEDIIAVGNYLSLGEKGAVDSLIKFYDTEQYPSTDAVYSKAEGIHLKKEDNYFPMPATEDISYIKQVEMEMMERHNLRRATPQKGFAIARSGTEKGFAEFDYLKSVVNNYRQVEHYKAFALALKDVNKFLNHPAVKAVIRERYGKEMWRVLDKWVKDVAYGSATRPPQDDLERISMWLRTNHATAVIGMNLSSVMKAPLSFVQGMEMGGKAEVLSELIECLFNWEYFYQKAKFAEDNDPIMKFRGYSQERELREYMQRKGALGVMGVTSLGDKSKEIGMIPWQIADKRTTTIVWNGSYNAEYKRTNNHAKAVAFASRVVRRTQPMGDVLHLPDTFRGGAVQKIFNAYKNQPSKNFNLIIETILKGRAKKIGGGELASNIAFYWIFGAYLFGVASRRSLKTDPIQFAKDMLNQGAGGLFIVGNLVNSWVSGYGSSSLIDSAMETIVNTGKGKNLDTKADTLLKTGSLLLGQPIENWKRILTGEPFGKGRGKKKKANFEDLLL